MYGSNVYNDIINVLILNETIYFIKKSKRFDELEAFFWDIMYFSSFNPSSERFFLHCG